MTIQEKVANGIALLDERGPKDWRKGIDLDRLDIEDPNRCVIGQLYGGAESFVGSLNRLGIGLVGAVSHGFAGYDYMALNAEWKLALSA